MSKPVRLFLCIAVCFAGMYLSGCGKDKHPAALMPATRTSSPVMSASAVSADGSVSLAWNRNSSAKHYNIYSSTTTSLVTSATGSLLTPGGISDTDFRHSGLTNGTAYYYLITSITDAGETAAAPVVSATPARAEAGAITLSGSIQYEDKEYGENGFTGNQPFKRTRYASIELVDSANPSVVVASTRTDASGAYAITTLPTARSLYVRLTADALLPGAERPISVKNLSGQEYAVGANNFVLSGNASANIIVPASTFGGVFNILDVLANGENFVHAQSGVYPSAALNAFWQKDNSTGTYYCSGSGSGCGSGEGIYISNNRSGDTDEYDDDVLYHEFGHFAAAHFSFDASPGGTHRLTSNDLDLRLSWSEGWSDQMTGSIKMWLSATGQTDQLSADNSIPLTEYIDTTATGAGIAIDMDNPDNAYGIDPVYFSYASSEIAVAKILLDLDRVYGVGDVWSVFADFQAHKPELPSTSNLELFWDRWHSLGATASEGIDSYFIDRLIYYSPDGMEPDNDFASAVTVSTEPRTLYASGDADYVRIDVLSGHQYTVTTSNMKNGADTLLSVYDDSLSLTCSNDNADGEVYSGDSRYPSVPADLVSSVCDASGVCHENRPDLLGSSVSFTASSTGTYYVKIESSPHRPVSAGRYGSYTLTVQ